LESSISKGVRGRNLRMILRKPTSLNIVCLKINTA